MELYLIVQVQIQLKLYMKFSISKDIKCTRIQMLHPEEN